MFKIKFDDLNLDDRSIIFYVSGYVSKSILSATKCLSCQELLVSDEDSVPLAESEFLKSINRGGLCYPSEYLTNICSTTYKLFQGITENKSLKTIFF